MTKFAVKIKNYKCFETESGFDDIKRVNLVIGKNNSGKSSLIDIIEHAVNNDYKFTLDTYRFNYSPEIVFKANIPEEVISTVFQKDTSGGSLGINHFAYGSQYNGKEIRWSKRMDGKNTVCSLIEVDEHGINRPMSQLDNTADFQNKLVNAMPIALEKKQFKRLNAERDIVPESSSLENIFISPNGSGITNVIQNFINNSNLPSAIVEKDILDALNEIFAHDVKFTDILCQLHSSSNQWEIYLEEQYNGRVALSKSGSGLKTVISVLAYLFLIPKLEQKTLNSYVFVFEELENNIHPALLRRLNNFIYKFSVEHDFIYFLTTHSNVMIDQFSKQEDAQIVHVKQGNGMSSCNTIQTYIDNNGILDDLDIRASDLLQANGIIWVEGPSDRIYLNKWIELWSNGELKEGTHYQIVFYGGRLLSHLSGKDPTSVTQGIKLLETNRNAAILIDSDKRSQQSKINDTKKRIKQEFEDINAMCWITKGKEIENYLSVDIVNLFLNKNETINVNQFQSFFEYLNSIENLLGTKYEVKKPLLAEKLIPYITKQNIESMLDINDNMNKLCIKIKKWNGSL